jgi:uncharacterized membrane protein (UPF0127 family)
MRSLSRAQLDHRWGLLLAAVLVLAACGNGTPPAVPGAQLPVAWLSVGDHRITAEIAQRPADRARGLMFRESLPPDHGMLFLFPEETIQSFWMRNTTIPLSIAYADARGRIVRIADLEPLDERPVTSIGPARYALEMNRGWFSAHAVVAGDQITGIPEAAAR